ncbi:MAG: response regulator, partial [Cyanobacteria bacterium J06641_2]
FSNSSSSYRYEDEELENNIDTFFSNLHPEDYPKVEAAIKEHFVQRIPLDIECRMLNKHNQYIWIRNQARAIWDESGNPIRIAGCIRDIEGLKKLEADLSLAKEAANLAKSEFLSKMTHELRTPLNAILGFAQVLHRQSNLEEQQQQYLDTIIRSGNHLLDLINDILDISKIEAGAIQLNAQVFDFYGLIDSIEQMLQLKCKNKGLQLNLHLDKNVPQYIRTDESRLRQVLINLLDNAIKFTDAGSVCLQITKYTINNRGDCCRLQFRVIDTGIGIAAEDLNSIFNVFKQSKDIQEYFGGTGLGLTISKSFIEMMGGEIRINSSLGEGTIVEFDIVVSTIVKEKFIHYSPKPQIVSLASENSKPLILIAEDNKDNHQLLAEMLCKIGFEIIQANNGEEAVEKWQKYKPDLILMDMRMPMMDGLQATRKIRNYLEGKDTIIIIAQTANAFNSDKKLIMSLGCDDFISKPFQEQELLEKIARHLKLRYIYSDEQKDFSEEEQIQISLESLKFMSSEWNLLLYQAASACNKKTVIELLTKIPEGQNSLIKQYLINLAKKFQFDEIVNLVSPSKVNDCSH